MYDLDPAQPASARPKPAAIVGERSGLSEQIASALDARAPARVVRHPDGRIEGLLLDEQIGAARYTVTRSYSGNADLSLSPREREIAHLIARGLPNKAISAVLGISAWTVATHLRRMFAKMGVTSRAAMVAVLADAGELSTKR
jgi:two-component system nitrate/nitrite response regulator NarL